ncbi:BPSS1780 family membrane protein [Pelistega sp. MC2]|uniref:BPSS1780 family membrane protein n=1 Tax=Pelistega sp. MC2 TaxID=1720297 RepID=UPI0008D937B2|nr:BPSS1780 family membrane protein [Pelistega sp. MC2]
MPLIHSHKPTIAFHWIKEGFSLLLKQFIPLSLLFVIVSLAFSIGTMLPLIGIFIALISLPITQMILFNAGYGIRLRGRLQLSDISQKIRSQQTILRLFGATLINFIFIYTILTITLPSIPIAIDEFMALSSEEMAKVILQTYTFSAMLMPVFCVSVYMLLTIWVYPLISWEDSRVIPAFKNSFRASMANALPLTFLFATFCFIFMLGIFVMQTVLLSAASTLASMVSLFIMHTLVIALYLSLFVAHMEIFYGASNQK